MVGGFITFEVKSYYIYGQYYIYFYYIYGWYSTSNRKTEN